MKPLKIRQNGKLIIFFNTYDFVQNTNLPKVVHKEYIIN